MYQKFFTSTALITALFAATLAGCNQQKETSETRTDQQVAADAQDPYIWLEEVEGKEALAFAEAMNEKSKARLDADSRFADFEARAQKIYNAKDKIPQGRLEGGMVHNFWQDGEHIRGIWRRTSLASYQSGTPEWETILDIDALAAKEGENWVYKGRDCLAPDFKHCMIVLSRGGSDAVLAREFNVDSKSFIEGGFSSPESKQDLAWYDADHLLIGTNFGEGTMNQSGYARQIRLWQRGTALNDASLLLDSSAEVVFNSPFVSDRADGHYRGVIQGPDFFTQVIHLEHDGKLLPLDLPKDIEFQGFFGDMMLIQLRKDWQVANKAAVAGSLVAVKVADIIAGQATAHIETLFTPDEHSAIQQVAIGEKQVFISVITDVTGSIKSFSYDQNGWQEHDIDLPAGGSVSIVSADGHSDSLLINHEGFLTPSALYYQQANTAPVKIYSLSERFKADDFVSEQKFAPSPDGTQVPYFIIHRKDMPHDQSTPTLLYGYGGFEIALTPAYLSGVSQIWLEEGGAYVIANIRGGGEYGPRWHQAALKENRERAYEDFIAVAEDLIKTGVTKAEKLGISGRSNGGLLTGAIFTKRPDLFGAVISGVPLLDMLRYHHLLAGASWVGEYGNPDIPEEAAWIRRYSPYQNVFADKKYPEVFFYTSTKDDRVHPGHARKMAKKMTDMGHPVLYYENTEGGHAAASNLNQRAHRDALELTYLTQKLKDGQ